jgi:hypothetical protein
VEVSSVFAIMEVAQSLSVLGLQIWPCPGVDIIVRKAWKPFRRDLCSTVCGCAFPCICKGAAKFFSETVRLPIFPTRPEAVRYVDPLTLPRRDITRIAVPNCHPLATLV